MLVAPYGWATAGVRGLGANGRFILIVDSVSYRLICPMGPAVTHATIQSSPHLAPLREVQVPPAGVGPPR